jgi:transposase-like protein
LLTDLAPVVTIHRRRQSLQRNHFLLSARRDASAARWFFRKALRQPHTVDLRTLTVDKNPAYPRAVTEMKVDGDLCRFSELRRCKYLTSIAEQDHRRVK